MIDVSTAAGCFVPFNWNRLSGLLKVLPRCFPFFAPLLGIEVVSKSLPANPLR
jgi:hypothetical protein